MVKSEERDVELQILPIWATVDPKKNPKPRMDALSRINMRIPISENALRMIHPAMIHDNR